MNNKETDCESCPSKIKQGNCPLYDDENKVCVNTICENCRKPLYWCNCITVIDSYYRLPGDTNHAN